MDLKQLISRLKNLKRITLSKEFKTKLGRRIISEIKIRTIDGYGVSETGEVVNLKPLKNSTIKSRSYYKNLDTRTSPSTSNQIKSGQLVDGIRLKLIDDGFEINPQSARKDGANGGEVAAAQEEMGRTIFKLDEDQREQLKDEVRDEIKKQLLKSLKG